jgi:hypothetical protein
MSGRTDTERFLDAYLAPEADRLPDRVIDAALADIARTPQRRALRAPWRFRSMPALTRATGIAVALVAVVGAGTLVYLTSNRPGGVGARSTPAPTIAPTTEPSGVAPGITRWKTYESTNIPSRYYRVGYPDDWSVNSRATREWRVGDAFPADELPYADAFVSPGQGDATIGLFVWEMPRGESVVTDEAGELKELGPDLESVDGLKAWAHQFCLDVVAASCEGFTQQAVPMCLNAGGHSCRGALLVPTAEAQYAFIMDWSSAILTGLPDLVRVVVVAREDGHPSAARYGGSVELLRSILTTMDVWTPGQQPSS